MSTKVIVLGSTGMLGAMVYSHLKRVQGFEVLGSAREDGVGRSIVFDAEHFNPESQLFDQYKPDYIINCIGIIKPYCKDNDPVGVVRAIKVNALFPHNLGKYCSKQKIKAIQIATDCVYSGKDGRYVESSPHDALDVYGKSKSLGEVFDRSLLNIRCSIMGPEKKGRLSLLEWFLAQPPKSSINGFMHHKWNGVTTMQFSELCQKIIEKQGVFERLLEASPIHHFFPNETVTKYQLLNILQKVYSTNFEIKAVSDMGPPVDRSISTTHKILAELIRGPRSLESAFSECRDFVKSGYFI